MTKYADWLILATAFILPAMSAFFGWVPNRADLAWLITASFTTVTGLLWFHLEPHLDRTNDKLVAAFIHMSLLMSLVVTTVLVPVIVLITGFDWWVVTLAGLAIALSAEVISALNLYL